MQLLNASVLDRFTRKHTDAAQWIAAWRLTVERAAWSSIDDVRKIFPSADGVKLRPGVVVTVFNVKGNEYRLITSIAYVRQAVYVLDAMSHAEYDKEKWKRKL